METETPSNIFNCTFMKGMLTEEKENTIDSLHDAFDNNQFSSILDLNGYTMTSVCNYTRRCTDEAHYDGKTILHRAVQAVIRCPDNEEALQCLDMVLSLAAVSRVTRDVDGNTAYDYLVQSNMVDTQNEELAALIKRLRPVYYHIDGTASHELPLSRAELDKIQKYWYDAMTEDIVNNFNIKSIFKFPQIDLLFERKVTDCHLPIPGMYGGYSLHFDSAKRKEGHFVLVISSSCRVSSGSGTEYTITSEGYTVTATGVA